MFTELYTAFNAAGDAKGFFDLQPSQLFAYGDAVWGTWQQVVIALGSNGNRLPLGTRSETVPTAVHRATHGVSLSLDSDGGRLVVSFSDPLLTALSGGATSLDGRAAEAIARSYQVEPGSPRVARPQWHHLIYAYLIENTRALEIFQRLVADALHDESFGDLSEPTHRWLRTTEELFLRTSSSGLVAPPMSAVRPDTRATRRNAYHRLFGMDLNHGAEDGGPYAYRKAQTANQDFVRTLQELLRELWRGYVNASNTSGSNTTDDSNIRELVNRLKTQLNGRRQSGGNHANLLREEFDAVMMMSWFRLALDQSTPLAADLKATGSAPEEVLLRLGDRARLAPHAKARSFLQLSGDLPTLLREIELGVHDTNVADLYMGTRQTSVLNIINHWSIATGVDLKSVPVSLSPR